MVSLLKRSCVNRRIRLRACAFFLLVALAAADNVPDMKSIAQKDQAPSQFLRRALLHQGLSSSSSSDDEPHQNMAPEHFVEDESKSSSIKSSKKGSKKSSKKTSSGKSSKKSFSKSSKKISSKGSKKSSSKGSKSGSSWSDETAKQSQDELESNDKPTTTTTATSSYWDQSIQTSMDTSVVTHENSTSITEEGTENPLQVSTTASRMVCQENADCAAYPQQTSCAFEKWDVREHRICCQHAVAISIPVLGSSSVENGVHDAATTTFVCAGQPIGAACGEYNVLCDSGLCLDGTCQVAFEESG